MSTRAWLLKNLQSMTKLNLSGLAAVVDLKFGHFPNSSDSVLLCGDNGLVIILKNGLVMPGDTAYTINLAAHNNIVFNIEWVDDSSFLTASADKTVCLWCIKSGTFVKNNVFLKHSSGVKTVSVSPDSEHVFVSGGRDGNIFLWDSRCNSTIQRGVKVYHKPVQSLMKAHEMVENFAPLRKKTKVVSTNSHPVESLNGVTCVKWLSGQQLLSTAAADSSILMWDIRKTSTTRGNSGCSSTPTNVQSFLYGGTSRKRIGYSNLVLGPHQDFFAVSCTDNNIYEFSLLNSFSASSSCSALSNVYANPGGCSYFTKMDLDPTGTFILSGSCDNKAFVFLRGFTEQQPVAELRCAAHKEEMPCVSWHKFDPTFMLTACEEGIVSLWAKDFMLAHKHPTTRQKRNATNKTTTTTTTDATILCGNDFEITGNITTNFHQLHHPNICDVIQQRRAGAIHTFDPSAVGIGKSGDGQKQERIRTLLSDKTNDASSASPSLCLVASPPPLPPYVASQALPITSNLSTAETITATTCSRAAMVVCKELKDLPDFVKSPPPATRHHLMSPPPSASLSHHNGSSGGGSGRRVSVSTPTSTCPANTCDVKKRPQTTGAAAREGPCDSILTPEKSQFMANFRSAFKVSAAATRTPRSPLSSPATCASRTVSQRGTAAARRQSSSSQVTPLKSNSSILNALSPIADFFRISPQVKRKLDQL